MNKAFLTILSLAATLAASFPAHADEPAERSLTISGSATLISQYRLRGVSFSDEDPAVQGALTLSHKSGFYIGTWASSQAGYGTFGGANMEVDLLGGYGATLGDTVLDGGLVWYLFPGTSNHDYAELYASVSHPLGPVRAKIGLNYAPKNKNIGTDDNLYLLGDLSLPVEGTPITLKSHVGYTDGAGSIYGGPRGHYVDYSIGADLAWRNLTFNASYVGTDINRSEADAYYTYPGTKPGSEIVDGAAIFSIMASF